jgi:hypothetical protein
VNHRVALYAVGVTQAQIRYEVRKGPWDRRYQVVEIIFAGDRVGGTRTVARYWRRRNAESRARWEAQDAPRRFAEYAAADKVLFATDPQDMP